MGSPRHLSFLLGGLGVVRAGAQGVTLIELMVVLSIVVTLAAVAIPRFLRARYNANEAAAITTLKTCVTALESYRSAQSPPAYPAVFSDLSEADPPYVTSAVTSGATKGYILSYEQVGNNQYTMIASPESEGVTGTRAFFVDESGVIRLDDAEGEPIQ